MGDRNWERVDELEAILAAGGFEDIQSTGLGQRSISVDFHVPDEHPATTQRRVKSSAHLSSNGAYKLLTIRFPSYDPDAGPMPAPELAERTVRDAVTVLEWTHQPPRRYTATVKMPEVGEQATMTIEIFTSDDGQNIHFVTNRDKFPPGALVDNGAIMRTAGDFAESFYDVLWGEV